MKNVESIGKEWVNIQLLRSRSVRGSNLTPKTARTQHFRQKIVDLFHEIFITKKKISSGIRVPRSHLKHLYNSVCLIKKVLSKSR